MTPPDLQGPQYLYEPDLPVFMKLIESAKDTAIPFEDWWSEGETTATFREWFESPERRSLARKLHTKLPEGEPLTTTGQDEIRRLVPGETTFQDRARELVTEYFNKHADATDQFKIEFGDTFVVWFSKTLTNWKALVSTTVPDGMYYEITHNGAAGETYLDAYKKIDNQVIPDE